MSIPAQKPDFSVFLGIIAHSTAAGEENSPAAVLCVFVHKKLSFVFARLSFVYDPISFCNEGNRLFLG